MAAVATKSAGFSCDIVFHLRSQTSGMCTPAEAADAAASYGWRCTQTMAVAADGAEIALS
ncbi:hypothetical protein [Nonomuraea helvata]|uniref:Uncharacterized protein n=1 Tax=Nonomuraea helvata TaxID=37484 RepID=A0ABV5S6S0_9ACTN